MAFGWKIPILLWRLAAICCGIWLENFAVFGKNKEINFAVFGKNEEMNFAVFGKNGEINFAVFGKMLIFAPEKTSKKRRKYGVQTKTL